MQDDAAFGEDPLECCAHAVVVGRQDVRAAGQEVKGKFVRVAPSGAQFVAQPKLHGECQFDAARTATDHRNPGRTRVIADPFQQPLPASVEAVDRLDRHGVLGRAGNLAHLRRGADVDGQLVVAHRWPIAAEHPSFCPIEAHGFIAQEARTSKLRQPAEVDVNLVVAVVAGNVARQHSGVGGMGVAADQCQPDSGQRMHAEAPEHADMAVTASDEHDIPKDRLIG